MAKLVRLQISGIRSFGPHDEDVGQVKFSSPLTLFLGQNGCGKTTIIEALKFACSGDLPFKTGHGFVNDPKINHAASTKGQVRLKMLDAKGYELNIFKSVQLTQKVDGLRFSRLDNTLKRKLADGKETCLNGRCADVDADICVAIGVSKSILNNVIFCHQEDAAWPLEEPKKVKEKFDAIFDATKYNKCIESIIKTIKEQKERIKMLKLELGALQDKKDLATRLTNQLRDKEEMFATVQSGVETKQKLLEPIIARIQEICNLETSLTNLEKTYASKQSECKSLNDMQRTILKNIVEEYEGSDQDLVDEIANFESTRIQNDSDIGNCEIEKQELEKAEKKINASINKEQVIVGALQEENRQYQNTATERNTSILKLHSKLAISETPMLESNEDALKAIKTLQDTIQVSVVSVKSLIKECDQEDNRLQGIIDERREKLTKTKQDVQSKRQQLEDYKKKIRNINSQIQEVNVSDKQLQNLETKISKIDGDLQTAKNIFEADAVSISITKKKQKIRQLEENLEILEGEYKILQQNYALDAEIESKGHEIDKREAEIHKLKNRHYDDFVHLFADDVPDKDYKIAVQSCKSVNDKKNSDLNNKINDKQKELTQLETKIGYETRKLSFLQEELEEGEKQIENVCKGAPFEQVLNKTHQSVEKLQKVKGQYSSAKIMYEKFVGEFQSEKPCCPVCRTGFNDNKKAVQNIITDITNKIRDIPNELEKVEDSLKQTQIEYSKLLQLQPLNDKVKVLSSETIISQKNELEQHKDALKLISDELRQLKEDLSMPKRKVEICNNVIADAILIDQHHFEISKAQAKIIELKSQLTQVSSNSTRQETEDKIEDLKNELSNFRKDCDTAQNKLERHNSRCHSLREEKTRLVETQLQIQKAVQSKPQLHEQLKEIAATEEKLKEEIAELQTEVLPLTESLNEAEASKKASKLKNNTKLNSAQENLNVSKKLCEDIEKLQAKIEVYMKKDIDKLLQAAVSNLTKHKEQIQMLNTAKNKIFERISELNKLLANLKDKKRTLTDNVTLREKRKEEQKLQKEITELKRQIGNNNYKTLHVEKTRLQRQHQEIFAEINKLNGRRSELQSGIKDLQTELHKPDLQQAFSRYKEKYMQQIINEHAVNDLNKYFRALEYAVIQFHKDRMIQINKTIRELWRTIYRGNDIDYIEIKTEVATKSKTARRVYNYNVVQMKNEVELDMRGRCSAGQRVLACLIIRMALAETFSQNCGILALDEPTTNLDRENIASLSEALARVVNSRQAEKNFQLLVITHDEEFLKRLTEVDKVSHYWKVKRNNLGNSKIEKEALY